MSTKSPEDKGEKEFQHYLSELNVSSQDLSMAVKDDVLDSLSVLPHAINLYKLKHGTAASKIQIRIYRDGKLITGYSQCHGDFKKLNVLGEKDFVKFDQLPNNYDLLLKDEYELWDISRTEIAAIEKSSHEHDYTIVVYWNIWSNYYSKVVLRELEKYLAAYEADDHKILSILVNTDRDDPAE